MPRAASAHERALLRKRQVVARDKFIHEQTKTQALVERAFLKVLDGSCRTPIGSISIIEGEKIIFSGQVLKPDGTEIISGHWEGLVGNPKDLGKMAGNEIKEKIDDSFFKQENFSH